MDSFRQEYWSGLPFPSPGDLPNPGIELGSPTLQADALPSEPPGKEQDLKEGLHFVQLLQCFLHLPWVSQFWVSKSFTFEATIVYNPCGFSLLHC